MLSSGFFFLYEIIYVQFYYSLKYQMLGQFWEFDFLFYPIADIIILIFLFCLDFCTPRTETEITCQLNVFNAVNS